MRGHSRNRTPAPGNSARRALQHFEDADTNAQQTDSGEHAQQRVAGDQSEHVADQGGDSLRTAQNGGQTSSSFLQSFLLPYNLNPMKSLFRLVPLTSIELEYPNTLNPRATLSIKLQGHMVAGLRVELRSPDAESSMLPLH